MPGEVQEGGVEAVATRAVAVSLRHDGPHVVVEHLPGHATEAQDGSLVRRYQRRDPLVGHELDVCRAAPAAGASSVGERSEAMSTFSIVTPPA
jgi:hypothetical protein